MDDSIKQCLWALISAPFEELVRDFVSRTYSKNIVNRIQVRGKFEKDLRTIQKYCDESIVEQLYLSIGMAIETDHTKLSKIDIMKIGLEFLKKFSKLDFSTTPFRVPRRTLIGIIKSKNYSIALERDKNPEINAVNMFFVLDGVKKRGKGKKIGFLLCRVCSNSLSFRGMHIHQTFRGFGLSRLFLATWIRFCRKIGFECRTEIIDKPLLALALQNLGFVPDVSNGFEIEIQSTNDGMIHVWSENDIRLRSAYSKSYCKKQNINILSSRPLNSRTIRVCCRFNPPRKKTGGSNGTMELDRRILERNLVDVMFYSSRVLAFLSSFIE